jgi:glycosyltransferase domain-containing protein
MFQPDQGDYTQLILTFNRPKMLARLLRYLANQGALFPIVVLDASSQDIQEQVGRIVTEQPLRAKHRRFPAAARHGDVVRAALAEIDTPYASLLPDDDLVTPGGNDAALAFLRQHPDFIAAQGYYIGFTELDAETRLTGIQDANPSVAEATPLQRLIQYAERYQPMVYAVYRTAALRASFAAPVGIQNVMLLELLQAFLAIREGKLERVPIVYTLRRDDGSLRARRSIHPFWQFVDSPQRLLSDYAAYREALVDAFAAGPDGVMGSDAVTRCIDLIHARFLQRHFEPNALVLELQKAVGMLPPDILAAAEAANASHAYVPGRAAATVEVALPGGQARRYAID